ncbi:AAA family ATPase [Vibrio chagasii]|uniref:AAA family ATPase n=1 Tax=Vibrio chagasii TaxID=170679 RepID=UPI0038CD7B99
MIINKVHIEKFRGFEDSEFTLGEYVTLIAGQNGTQKSTLLGMISQPFTITDKEHPLYGEKPLSGDNFRSAFKDKFRMSPTFDIPKEHEWTLHLKSNEEPFTIQSMIRSKDDPQIRFWRKGNRTKGTGYIQLPVIYLSLKRLLPLGEEKDSDVSTNNQITLTPEELTWFSEHYQSIMINRNDSLSSVDYVTSPNKKTLAVSTSAYDWNTNSAGQDNIGKILLAILSFKRLKEKHGSNYEGGILAIDEIDATLYPGSQVKLLDAFVSICKELTIQVIATTHSLQLLEKADKYKKSKAKKFNTVYLKKQDSKILINDQLDFERVIHNLNMSLGQSAPPKPKLPIYTEDKECIQFAKAMLDSTLKRELNFLDVSLGCGNYLQLVSKKVPSFIFPNSIVILDGDTRPKLEGKRLKNFICLPGELNPEGMVATFLNNLSESDPFWTKKSPDYSKQFCFMDFSLEQILGNRSMAKAWYKRQLGTGNWGREANLLYKAFLPTIQEEVDLFVTEFKKAHTQIQSAK